MISEGCTMLLPFHRALDTAREASMGQEKIGTTGKGIGPAYEDRASRRAVLFGDLFDKTRLRDKLELSLREKNFLLEKFYHIEPIQLDRLMEELQEFAEELAPYRCRDSSLVIHRALKAGKKILFEGAQGTLLDLLHGTYPYVTSSSTLSGSACTGSGIGPGAVQKVIGITKAYTTRVGSGPFPTELKDDVGARLQKEGREFGATTGRPRRCGWIDLVALRYAIRINGITNLALMKLDVLSGHDEVGVCTDYLIRGEKTRDFPISSEELAQVQPVIQLLPGWDEDLTKGKSVKDLPHATREYIHFIGNELGTPIDVISVGPGREQTLWIKPLFS
jgi:adenylosuccinate synthase